MRNIPSHGCRPRCHQPGVKANNRDPASQHQSQPQRDSRAERESFENWLIRHRDFGNNGGISRQRELRHNGLSGYAEALGVTVQLLLRHLKMMNYLSTYDGTIYRRDIENFKYSCLRSSDSDFLDEIRLPPIYINHRQGTVSVLVPDNTPIGTADVDGRRRSRRKSFLRYQHGVIDDDDEGEVSSADDYDESDNFLTVRGMGGGGGGVGGGEAIQIPRDRRDRRLTFAPAATRRTSVSFPSFEFGDTDHGGVHGGDHGGDVIDGQDGVDYGDTYGGQVGHFGRHGSGRAGSSSKGLDGDCGYAHYHRGSVSRRNSFYDQDRDKQLTPGGQHRDHSSRSGGLRRKWSMIPGSGGRTARDHVPGSGRGGDAHDRGHSTDRHGVVQQGVTFADGTFTDEEMAPASADASGHLPPIAGKNAAHPGASQMEYGVAARPKRKPFDQLSFWQQMDIFKRAQRNAYATVLATAQLRRPLPAEPWMFGSRIARAFVFSYFGTSRKGGGANDDPGGADKPAKGKGKKKKKKKKKKKLSEMKSIFGDVMPHDYYPGGKRNLDGYAI